MSGRLLLAFLLCAVSPAVAASAPAVALLPKPFSVSLQSGDLPVDGGFAIEWRGHRDAMLDRAVARFQRDIGSPNPSGAAPLRIDVKNTTSGAVHDANEHYALVIGHDGVRLTSDSPIGALRGLATLRQAIIVEPDRRVIPHMAIDDSPRFRWRGVMLDVARHFVPAAVLKRQIDAMERVKLNVLHLDLGDDAAVRVESLRYPNLQTGASPEVYSQAAIRELVAYAADRGVTVVPEFDVPGSGDDFFEAFVFVDGLFGEMAGLFAGPYVHVGKAALEPHFLEQVRKSVAAHGKTVVGWEDIARTTIPDDVIVDTWRTPGAVARATTQGNRVIASCGYSLDNLPTGASLYAIDPLDTKLCGPMQLTAPQQALVLGSEIALSTEMVTADMIDDRLWPGAAVVAERLWSPATVIEVDDMYRRLIATHERLRAGGLADATNRSSAASKLSPGAPEPVALLLDLVAPVPQADDELADAASPDSLVVLGFDLEAKRFAGGECALAKPLKDKLAAWRDNHARYAAAAKGKPQLETALPISQDLSALAGVALEAVSALESGNKTDPEWRKRADVLLARQEQAAQASTPQPPADLRIAITPGVRTLVETAEVGLSCEAIAAS